MVLGPTCPLGSMGIKHGGLLVILGVGVLNVCLVGLVACGDLVGKFLGFVDMVLIALIVFIVISMLVHWIVGLVFWCGFSGFQGDWLVYLAWGSVLCCLCVAVVMLSRNHVLA